MSGYWVDNGAKRRRVDIETLQRLAGEGKPLLEIARIMGFHDWTISKVSKRAGVEIVDVVRRHDGKRGGRYPKHIETSTTPPPRPANHRPAKPPAPRSPRYQSRGPGISGATSCGSTCGDD